MAVQLPGAAVLPVPVYQAVQEKETIANANAIKKIPTKPPLSAWASTFVPQELGNVSSNAPKNDAAKMINIKKKKIIFFKN